MNTQRLPKHEVLPSGKTIIRTFDKNGSLCEEDHAYGSLDIGISYKFVDGVKIEETYFSKARLVSRKSYEKARSKYPICPHRIIRRRTGAQNCFRGRVESSDSIMPK